jgi:KDO2-lipid IV(A) lauroyltransferase
MVRSRLATARDRVTGRAVDIGFASGWRLVRALPEARAAALFQAGADVGTRRDGRGVQQLRRNLRRVIGPEPTSHDLDDLVQRALRSYARYWMETFRLPSMDRVDVAGRVAADGAEHIDAAHASGRGFILALPHSGNWDVSGVWLLDRGYPFTTVAERLKPESLFDRFVAYREGLGMEILPLSGGERPPADVLGERLRAGRGICLLADRDLSKRGVAVSFFGAEARFPPGPALLAATTGAALLPVTAYFTDDGWGHRIGAPIELGDGRLRAKVQKGTQALADAFAARIAERPQDWHMLQRLWTADSVPHPPQPQPIPVQR